MNIFLQENSWKDVENIKQETKGVVIIPVGSTEQHGYHLPLGTDTYVAEMLAVDAAKETNVLVTPPVWFGWSPHHMALPGTITIRPEILTEYLYDIIQSLCYHGFKKIIVINGHRIVNITWMQIAAEKAQRTLGVKVKLFDPAYMSKDIVEKLSFGPVGHAEEIETSHMLYKHPEFVNLDKAVDNPIKVNELYSVDPSYSNDTLCYVPSTLNDIKKHAHISGGASGEPSKSDKEKGKKYHRHLIDNLVKIINDLKKEEIE